MFAVVGMSMVGASQGPVKSFPGMQLSKAPSPSVFKPTVGMGGAGPSLSRLKSNLKDQIQRANEFDLNLIQNIDNVANSTQSNLVNYKPP